MSVRFALVSKLDGDHGQPSLNSFFFDHQFAGTLLGAAEDAGFNGVIIDDPAGLLGNLDLSSYAATRTETLSIIATHWAGIMSPEAAAQQVATIANAANGRLSLRIVTQEEPERGEEPDDADHLTGCQRTDEYVMLLKRLWLSERPFDYEGRFHRLREAFVPQKNVFDADIAIRMGGTSGSAIKVAGRHADIFELTPGTLHDVRTMMERVISAASRHGRARAMRFALPVTVLKGDGARPATTHPACTIASDDPLRAAHSLLPFVEAGVSEFMVSGLGDRHAIVNFGRTVLPIVRNSALRMHEPVLAVSPVNLADFSVRRGANPRGRGRAGH